jgi:hypothetical protein
MEQEASQILKATNNEWVLLLSVPVLHTMGESASLIRKETFRDVWQWSGENKGLADTAGF